MAIAIDASTPALVTGNSVTSITTAAFTAPSTCLFVAVSLWDTTGAVTPSVAMTNNGTALTWVFQKKWDRSLGTQDGLVHIYTALLATGRSITVTSTPSNTGLPFDERGALKVYAVTGHDTAAPVGASGAGASTTNSISVGYTSTADLSWAFGGACDATTDHGAPTSTDVADAFALTFAIEGEAVRKAAATTPSGTAETLNFDGVGAGAMSWNWAAIEVLQSGPAPVNNQLMWITA